MLPKLVDAGWDTEPHRFNEQVTFTDPEYSAGGTPDGTVWLASEVTDIGNLQYFVYSQ